MRRTAPIALLLFLLLTLPFSASPALARGQSLTLPKVVERGQAVLVRFTTPVGVKNAALFFLGKPQPVVQVGPGKWRAALGADLDCQLGPHQLLLKVDGRDAARGRVKVVEKDYGVRRITVSKKFMSLTDKQLAWHKTDLAAMKKAYALYARGPRWTKPWLAPVSGESTGSFGRRSVINGEPRSPHGGMDFRAAKGDPVKAPAAGKAVLVKDTYFGGLVLLIHHGAGVISGYRHLSACLVKPGDLVKPGQVVAKVGMSGRVTGPHLHYDIHLGGARVDPASWQKLSGLLAAGK